jgi:hypothetical protein
MARSATTSTVLRLISLWIAFSPSTMHTRSWLLRLMNPMLSKSTMEKYRAACHVPRRGPDGFLRSLYGYVCGNITTEREDLTAGKYDCEIL